MSAGIALLLYIESNVIGFGIDKQWPFKPLGLGTYLTWARLRQAVAVIRSTWRFGR